MKAHEAFQLIVNLSKSLHQIVQYVLLKLEFILMDWYFVSFIYKFRSLGLKFVPSIYTIRYLIVKIANCSLRERLYVKMIP